MLAAQGVIPPLDGITEPDRTGAGNSRFCHRIILVDAITAHANCANQGPVAAPATWTLAVYGLSAGKGDDAVMKIIGEIVTALNETEFRTKRIRVADAP